MIVRVRVSVRAFINAVRDVSAVTDCAPASVSADMHGRARACALALRATHLCAHLGLLRFPSGLTCGKARLSQPLREG